MATDLQMGVAELGFEMCGNANASLDSPFSGLQESVLVILGPHVGYILVHVGIWWAQRLLIARPLSEQW